MLAFGEGNQPHIHLIWLVVSTHFKNISQNGNLPQIGVKKKYLKPPSSYIVAILCISVYHSISPF